MAHGALRKLSAKGLVDIVPCHYDRIEDLIATGRIRDQRRPAAGGPGRRGGLLQPGRHGGLRGRRRRAGPGRPGRGQREHAADVFVATSAPVPGRGLDHLLPAAGRLARAARHRGRTRRRGKRRGVRSVRGDDRARRRRAGRRDRAGAARPPGPTGAIRPGRRLAGRSGRGRGPGGHLRELRGRDGAGHGAALPVPQRFRPGADGPGGRAAGASGAGGRAIPTSR